MRFLLCLSHHIPTNCSHIPYFNLQAPRMRYGSMAHRLGAHDSVQGSSAMAKCSGSTMSQSVGQTAKHKKRWISNMIWVRLAMSYWATVYLPIRSNKMAIKIHNVSMLIWKIRWNWCFVGAQHGPTICRGTPEGSGSPHAESMGRSPVAGDEWGPALNQLCTLREPL